MIGCFLLNEHSNPIVNGVVEDLHFYVNAHVLIVCSKDTKHNSTTEVITQSQSTKFQNCVAKKVTASDWFVRV